MKYFQYEKSNDRYILNYSSYLLLSRFMSKDAWSLFKFNIAYQNNRKILCNRSQISQISPYLNSFYPTLCTQILLLINVSSFGLLKRAQIKKIVQNAEVQTKWKNCSDSNSSFPVFGPNPSSNQSLFESFKSGSCLRISSNDY